MLRTYLCQVGEATPMTRLAGTVFGRTKQAVERVLQGFIRQKPPVPQAPVIHAEAGRNLATRIHGSSKGLLAKYLQRCQNSELVGAMRSKYGHRGEFRTVGHTLSAFALVGIAAGTQWKKQDLDFKPFYEDVVAIFAADKIEATRHQYPSDEVPEWSAKISSDRSSALCASFELINSDEYIIPSTAWSNDDDDDDISILSDDNVDDAIILITEEETTSFNGLVLSGELQPQLDCALSMIESQRMELISLRETITQLSSSLVEILYAEQGSLSDSQMNLSSIEKNSEADKQELEKCMLKWALMKVSVQEQELRELRMVQEHQQLQLQELSLTQEYRPAVIRSSFCKRDACCGPGIDDT